MDALDKCPDPTPKDLRAACKGRTRWSLSLEYRILMVQAYLESWAGNEKLSSNLSARAKILAEEIEVIDLNARLAAVQEHSNS